MTLAAITAKDLRTESDISRYIAHGIITAKNVTVTTGKKSRGHTS